MEMTASKDRHTCIIGPVALLLAAALLMPIGCGHGPIHPTTPSPAPVIKPWTLESYQTFLADNQRMMDRIYGNDYVEVRFMVDTSQGSILVQRLIEPDAVRYLAETILPPDGNDRQILDAARRYVTTATRFEATPSTWPTIRETLKSGKADCKGRSLLLLSLLLAGRRTAYAAIGNGHMWVVAMVDGHWQHVETDTDSQRSQIYRMPGFYAHPLYKIDATRTLKRRRIDRP